MKEIRMVDLKTQYDDIRGEIDDAIREVIHSTDFIRGKAVNQFEEELAEYLGTASVISCGNGTDALQIAMMALGLKPGDEVITTDFTFIATAETIALLGLKPVFVDPEPRSFNIDPELVEKAVTSKTRAILPVHLFGQCADMDPLTDIAKRYDLFIIEDTAQATGADHYSGNGTTRKAGTIGEIGCTSFFPSKNLGCYGDGGAIFTGDSELASRIRSIANHGMTRRYWHDHVGVNSRLDTIQAAILRVKLRNLDRYNRARQAVADKYDAALRSQPGIILPYRSSFSSHIFHQYTLKLNTGVRERMRDHLTRKKIPSMVYYPVPLHRQAAYRYLGYEHNSLAVTGELSGSVLSLPMHTELDDEQINYIISNVLEFFNKI